VRFSTPVPALRQARQHLLEYGATPPGAVSERLSNSWARSIAAGLLPVGRPPQGEHASGGELRQCLARNHALLAHSRPVMEYLFEQVRHVQSVVILADQHGTLMHTLGDAYFLSKAERVALATGASWREEHRGTNAIGTAIAEQGPVEIHGAEHFLERNGFLTCAAAPIRSSCGQVLGILDISGDQHNGHPMTLGLVSTAARMIENRLMQDTCRRNIRLHLHPQAEGIGTVAEGIVALSEDGWIVGANRFAMALLHLDAKALGAVALDRVLGLSLDAVLDQHRRRPGQPCLVRLHDGSTVFVLVQADAAAIAVRTGPRGLQAPHTDALARLDSGDLQWHSATEKARRVLDKPIPVLLQGESGVGKEYFARAMHDSSQRARGPFVAINCAAVPENLIEAELFGYAPGAFTGARKEGSLGRLREANGGTLFLDEIGDMPLALQTRLLRVLQERTVTPVGGARAISVDFALVCASHCQLREATELGRFRSDLYYRINGLTLQLPALRQRGDFDALCTRLLDDLSPDRAVQLAPELQARLRAYAWPGNLRQFASVLRTACAMLDPHEDRIALQHLPDDMVQTLQSARSVQEQHLSQDQAMAGRLAPDAGAAGLGVAGSTGPAGCATGSGVAGSEVAGPASYRLHDIELSTIRHTLQDCRGNVSLAARTLGISRQTLYRKLERMQAARPAASAAPHPTRKA